MNTTVQIAKLFKSVYFGGNWTFVNLKDTLASVDWRQATTKLESFNTIAALVYHINYYVVAVSSVLQRDPLNAHDKYSFDVPVIESQADWEALLDKSRRDAENFIALVEQLPDTKLWETFAHEKYGNYYRNLHGVIEHAHYHLGQIVLLKKLIGGK